MNTEETVPVELTKEEYTDLMVKEVAAATLNREFKDSFYSVCAVGKAAKMSGKDRFHNYMESREYKILLALHCVSYKDIPEEIKRNIPLLTQAVLRPLIGELKISDHKHNGVRLFETSYLPESIRVAAAEPTPPPKVAWYEHLFARIGLGSLD